MTRRISMPLWFAALLIVASWSSSASAGLVLSFDSSTYSTSLGNTVSVRVLVSQVTGGPQVGVGNELLSASIELSYATGGAAIVPGTSSVLGGSLWDDSISSTSKSGANTLFDVTLVSIFGIADLSTPQLLATFTFNGVATGVQTIRVSQQDPNSADFITALGNVVDPANTPSATISVANPVPEPGSLAMMTMASLLVGPIVWRRRPGHIKA